MRVNYEELLEAGASTVEEVIHEYYYHYGHGKVTLDSSVISQLLKDNQAAKANLNNVLANIAKANPNMTYRNGRLYWQHTGTKEINSTALYHAKYDLCNILWKCVTGRWYESNTGRKRVQTATENYPGKRYEEVPCDGVISCIYNMLSLNRLKTKLVDMYWINGYLYGNYGWVHDEVRKLNSNTKFSKVLDYIFAVWEKKIADHYKYKNYEVDYGYILEQMKLCLSEIIQELHTPQNYTIVVSTHPIDFFFMSMFGVTSCYRIGPTKTKVLGSDLQNKQSGEYCSGILEYITGEYTAVCYMYDSVIDDEALYNIPRKQWRMLLHFDDDTDIVGVAYDRQYPSTREATINAIDDVFDHYIRNHMGLTDRVEQYYSPPRNNATGYVDNISRGYVYYDSGDTEKEIYVDSEWYVSGEGQLFVSSINGDVYCLCCGDNVPMTNGLVCEDCKDVRQCNVCGSSYRASECEVLNGEVVCHHCLEEHYVKCDHCGTYMLAEDSNEYHTMEEDTHVCNYCYDNYYKPCTECGELHYVHHMYTVYNGDKINRVCRSCKEAYYVMCYNCGDYHKPEYILKGTRGRDYCRICFNRYFETCKVCGAATEKGDSYNSVYHVDNEGKCYKICQECYDGNIVECDKCGQQFMEEDTVELDGQVYCNKCQGDLMFDSILEDLRARRRAL